VCHHCLAQQVILKNIYEYTYMCSVTIMKTDPLILKKSQEGHMGGSGERREEKEDRESWSSLLDGIDQGHMAVRRASCGQTDGA
jgi:hypothetical protein